MRYKFPFTKSEVNALALTHGGQPADMETIWNSMPYKPVLFENIVRWADCRPDVLPINERHEQGWVMEDKPVYVEKRWVYPYTRGTVMREVLSLIPETGRWAQSPLPRRNLKPLLEEVISKADSSIPPCHVSYLGKPVGLFMSNTHFLDYLALQAIMVRTGYRYTPNLVGPGLNLMPLIMYAPPARTLQNAISAVLKIVKEPNQFAKELVTAYGIPSIHEDDVVEAVIIPYKSLAWNLVDTPEGWLDFLKQLPDLDTIPTDRGAWVPFVEDAMDRVETGKPALEKAAAAMPPEPQVPPVPEFEKSSSMVGLDKWQAKETRAFMFIIDVFNTREHARPTQAKMKMAQLDATGKNVQFYESELQVFRDEQGTLMKKVVRFLEKPDDLPKQPYLPIMDKLTHGRSPKDALSRVTKGTEMLGYFLSMPYFKNLLALMSWVIDQRGLSQDARDIFRILGVTADSSVTVRQMMLKHIYQQNMNESMLLSVCGISMAQPSHKPISLAGVVIPTRKMRIIREALLQSIPDFFDRVRAKDIPDTQGLAWLDYLDRVLGDEPVVDVEPEMVTPAVELPVEVEPTDTAPVDEDIFRDLRRDALFKDLETITLKEPEEVPVGEPVVEEIPTQEVEIAEPEVIEPEVVKVETPVQRVSRERRERTAERVGKLGFNPLYLNGMTADDIWEEALTNPQGYFACEVEGPARMTPELRTLMREGKADLIGTVKGTIERYKRAVELESAVISSKLAVMEWQHFTSTVDSRRHPAKRWLEGLLGRELNFHKADVVDITPDRIGELPGLVAGLHRNYPDRLCVVRVVMRHKVTRYTCTERAERRLKRRGKSPLVIKTRQISATRLHRQRFQFAEVPMLAVFPAGWMAPVAEPWMPGLFGTPYDPTLLDFCDTMPKEWWAELAKVIPAKDETRPVLDIRAMRP